MAGDDPLPASIENSDRTAVKLTPAKAAAGNDVESHMLTPPRSHPKNERARRIALTAITGFVSKSVSAISVYLMIPMLLNAMGTELFGVWSTFHSLLAMMAFADFGIGNGMLNAVAVANARKDRIALQQTVSTAAILLAAIASLCAATLYPLLPSIARLTLDSGLPPATAGVALSGLVVFGAYALLSMPLSTGDRLATALQEGFTLHFVRMTIHLVTLAAIFVVTRFGGTFSQLCAATVMPGLLGSGLTWLLVTRNRAWLVPRLDAFRGAQSRKLLRSGLGFFLIQIIGLIGFSLDTVIIARGLGADAAAEYALASRYFSFALVTGNILLAPLWPAYADAASRGERGWVKRTLLISLATTFAFGALITGTLFLVRDWLVPVWLGKGYAIDSSIMSAMAAWTVVSLVGSSIAMFWNGMHWLRMQCFFGALFATVSLAFKIMICNGGTVDQFVRVNTLCFCLLEIIPGLILTFFLLRDRLRSSVVN